MIAKQSKKGMLQVHALELLENFRFKVMNQTISSLLGICFKGLSMLK